DPEELGYAPVGETLALERAHAVAIEAGQAFGLKLLFLADQVLDLRKEPAIDAAESVHFLERHAGPEGVGDIPDAMRPWHQQLLAQAPLIFLRERQGQHRIEPVDADFQAAQGLLQ